jgi:hypothetical protein
VAQLYDIYNDDDDKEECGPCPVFADFTLEFALQLKKKHGKTSTRVRKTRKNIRQ